MVGILVGLRTDLREWLSSGNKAKSVQDEKNQVVASQTTYQPFSSVPEGNMKICSANLYRNCGAYIFLFANA